MMTTKSREQYKGWTIEFERNEVWLFAGKRVTWSWYLPRTGDWATKFGTKAEAQRHARRMVTGLIAEGAEQADPGFPKSVFGETYWTAKSLMTRRLDLIEEMSRIGESDDRVTELVLLEQAMDEATEGAWR